jgi:hypothetical protein
MPKQEGSPVVCGNADCRVAETSRCVEGLTLEVCPHYGHDADGRDTKEAPAQERSRGVALPSAGTLTPTEASKILCQGVSRVIAVIGPRDSGKTSLVASVYDLFQEGAVEGVEFSRSRTLHAFEQVCHDVRAMSRRGVPHMHRTPLGEVRFYHLEIGGGAAGEKLALLLGDRAGEEYREAADDVSVVARFYEVARADTLTVLVDGERLLGGGRHNLRSDITMMLQGLRDGGGMRQGCRLAVVLTKLDAIRVSPLVDRAMADFQRLVDDVRRLFGDLASRIEPFQVAASPKTEILPRGAGLNTLLSFWLGAASGGLVSAERIEHPRAFARLRVLEEFPVKSHD